MKIAVSAIHPEGEPKSPSISALSKAISEPQELDTFAGKLFVEWDPEADVTPMGQLPFFINFLKLGGRFEPWVDSCPLNYTSNNASSKTDILGSFLLSILSGHRRYAHMASLRADGVSAQLLGMTRMVSDDTAIRAIRRLDADKALAWMQEHLLSSCFPLLVHPWILDADVTIKPLYGHQEEATVGYNPKKPGRPSHTYHSYMVANLRLVLEVDVQAGNQSASSYSAPGLIALLSRLPESHQPQFVRGDCDWGSDAVMSDLEDRGMDYLFKLKRSANVKKLINKHHCLGGWTRFKEGWEAVNACLKLPSWSCERRAVIVRRRVKDDADLVASPPQIGQQELDFLDAPDAAKIYEYAVLITSLSDEVVAIVQHYRDRADCENVFDEMKNHWGWGGYTTKDIAPCHTMSRMIALIYNWWSLFVRLINQEGHWEALTSRPLLLSSVGRLTHSGRQKTMVLTSRHANADQLQKALAEVQTFFKTLKANAPQLSILERWTLLLEKAVEKLLPVGNIGPPALAERA